MVEIATGIGTPSKVTTKYDYDRTRAYNAAGWLLTERHGLDRTTSYGYDSGGPPTTVSDSRPQTVT